MAINITGSKLPQFPNTQPTYYRGSAKQVRKGTPTPADTGYGDNGYLGPASVPVSKSSNLSDFDTTVTDPVLDAIKSGGAKSQDGNFQTRDVGKSSTPTTPGMKRQTETDVLSAVIRGASATPTRQQDPDKVFGKRKP